MVRSASRCGRPGDGILAATVTAVEPVKHDRTMGRKITTSAGVVTVSASQTFMIAPPPAMKAAAAPTLVDTIKAYATEHYNDAGAAWDVVIETMTDAQIAEIIGKAQTTTGGVRRMRTHLAPYADKRADIEATADTTPTRPRRRRPPRKAPAKGTARPQVTDPEPRPRIRRPRR